MLSGSQGELMVYCMLFDLGSLAFYSGYYRKKKMVKKVEATCIFIFDGYLKLKGYNYWERKKCDPH